MAAPKGPSLSFVCFCVVLHFCEVLAVKEVARTSGEGMSHGNFRRHPFHYLNLTGAAKTFFVHQTDDCALFCLRAVSCVSFNMAAYPDANSNFLCELLASDKYNASCMFLPHSYFHHYSVNNPCAESPCKYGGTCIALYHINDFQCQCLPGFSAKNCEIAPKDCSELYKIGITSNGVYSVDPEGKGVFQVYCDMATDGGGWAVFQRRQDGSQDFFLGWSEYKAGFGNLTGEFWLGLDKIHRLTASRASKLRVELGDWEGHRAYAKYRSFSVGDEQSLYVLSVSLYSGNAGNSFKFHNNMKFSTKDNDHDEGAHNCAAYHTGAWWYKNCHASNLNGQYLGNATHMRGVRWASYRGELSLQFSEMKLRPVN